MAKTDKQKKLKVFYDYVASNFGDILNEDIFRSLGFNIEYASKKKCDVVGIGSLLDLILCNKNEYLKRLRYKFYKPAIVWGTGFIKEEEANKVMLRALDIYAVRGYHTLNRLKKFLNVKINNNVAIGDPGLLISHFFDPSNIQKKYSLGVISHINDQNHNSLDNIKIESATFIDIKQKPLDFINRVAECECIVSSAMHGLICADSLGIPNIRIIQSGSLVGGNYKFNDYYSAFGIDNHKFINLNEQIIKQKDLEWIMREYPITQQKVHEIQNALLEVFPL